MRLSDLTNALQRQHPGSGQVAVLQNYPGALFDTILNHTHGDGTLALTQRQGGQLVSCKTLKERTLANTQTITSDTDGFVKYSCTFSSPNFSRLAMGSEPGERMKMRGAEQWLSAKAFPRSKGGASIKARPKVSETNSCTTGTIWRTS